jgi:hypothetical protein
MQVLEEFFDALTKAHRWFAATRIRLLPDVLVPKPLAFSQDNLRAQFFAPSIVQVFNVFTDGVSATFIFNAPTGLF